MTDAATAHDHAIKRQALLALAEQQGSASVLLRTAASVAWYLEGGRVQVGPAGDPVVAVRVTPDADELRVLANERERVVAEELRIVADVVSVDWFGRIDDAPMGTLQETDIAAQIGALRRRLLPTEHARYRALGADAATAITAVMPQVRPDWSERALAAAVAASLIGAGIEPLVLLVAGEARIGYRHPLPTAAPLGRRAMIVVCGRRDGLIANLTRWLHRGVETAAELDAAERIRAVEAVAIRATREGETLGAVLDRIASAYPENGFAVDEWRSHHQGGPTGYLGRDPRATPGARELVEIGQAFAWNPTAPGTKIEDTILLGASGFEVLTADPTWPSVEVAGLARPLSWPL
jgi:Xaa-Pro aminopeptidase